jgi:ribonuclease HI
VRLQWIPAHRGTKRNEKADKRAKEIAEIIEPLNKASVRYLSAVFSLLKNVSKKSWDSRWNGGKKGRYIYRLIS